MEGYLFSCEFQFRNVNLLVVLVYNSPNCHNVTNQITKIISKLCRSRKNLPNKYTIIMDDFNGFLNSQLDYKKSANFINRSKSKGLSLKLQKKKLHSNSILEHLSDI